MEYKSKYKNRKIKISRSELTKRLIFKQLNKSIQLVRDESTANIN